LNYTRTAYCLCISVASTKTSIYDETVFVNTKFKFFFCFFNNIVTVHSVHSNVAKIHSRLPAAMEFWLVCLGILAYSAKTPRGIVVCEQ